MGCQLLHLGRLHLDVMAEIEVAGIVERHEMDVCMWHIDANDGNADFDTGADLFEAFGYTATEAVQSDKEVVVEVEDIVDLFLGDAEDVALDNGIDIEECQAFVGFGDFVAGYFTCHYA